MLLLADQLNPIPKRIVHMAAAHPRNIARLVHLNSRASQALQQSRIIAAP
jgi:hypothetical protein